MLATINHLTILCSIDDITGYTEKMDKFENITSSLYALRLYGSGMLSSIQGVRNKLEIS